ncbi:MAG: hemerythrin family protein [Alphaproteobacteria bacterium]
MTLVWRDNLTVDGSIIDEDHRHLIEIINRFEELGADGLTNDEGLEILYALKFYAQTHFKREESIQNEIDYPYRESHAQEHKHLIRTLELAFDDVKKQGNILNASVVKEITDLLKQWLVDHIIKSDLRMKPFIEARSFEKSNLEKLSDIEIEFS